MNILVIAKINELEDQGFRIVPYSPKYITLNREDGLTCHIYGFSNEDYFALSFGFSDDKDRIHTPHRPESEGPSQEEYCRDGFIQRREYRHQGVLHRNQGPALEYYKDNVAYHSVYYVDGIEHRPASEGPQHIDNFADTKRVRERTFRENGRIHRRTSDGPARILFDVNNKLIQASYYTHGHFISSLDPKDPQSLDKLNI